MKTFLAWIADLKALVRWFRNNFESQKAVFIYKNGERSIITFFGPVRHTITLPRACAAVVSDPNEIPTTEIKTREFRIVAQEYTAPTTITVYEEITEDDW